MDRQVDIHSSVEHIQPSFDITNDVDIEGAKGADYPFFEEIKPGEDEATARDLVQTHIQQVKEQGGAVAKILCDPEDRGIRKAILDQLQSLVDTRQIKDFSVGSEKLEADDKIAFYILVNVGKKPDEQQEERFAA